MKTLNEQEKNERSAWPGVSVAFALTLVATILVVATAGVILAVVHISATTSIKELLREKAEIVSHSIVERVRSHLEPVAAQSDFTARILNGMDLEAVSDEVLGATLYASMAGLPQISAIALVDENITLTRSFRNRPEERFRKSNWSDDENFTEMIRAAWTRGQPFWGSFFFAETSGTTLLNYVTPLEKKNGKRYALISSVSLKNLSGFIETLQHEMTGRSFILHGTDAVLAYSEISEPRAAINDLNPLSLVSDFTDSPLRHIWSENRLHDVESDLENDIEVRVVELTDESYVFLFRKVDGFGPEPWYVGSHFPLAAITSQIARSETAIVASLVIILAAALTALMFSRVISRPIVRLATAAKNIKNWDLAENGHPKTSIFREINEANEAFSYAKRAFESLQAYVPSVLAHRLVEHGDPINIESEEHTITILFTDIVGFTGLAEDRPPKDVVALLNSHFTLLAQCIEAENGIVDKFMGDSAMAFWGGLVRDDQHAVHACRAALRISEAMHHENEVRRANGKQQIRVRIGVHTGKAMLGNIGSAGRINYTVIGDSVNTAQRLEALAREVGDKQDEVAALISGDTAKLLGADFIISPVGRKVLHGRHDQTEVFMLKRNPESINLAQSADDP